MRDEEEVLNLKRPEIPLSENIDPFRAKAIEEILKRISDKDPKQGRASTCL